MTWIELIVYSFGYSNGFKKNYNNGFYFLFFIYLKSTESNSSNMFKDLDKFSE